MPSLGTKLVGIFEDRAPNTLFSELIYSELPGYSEKEIDSEIQNLVSGGILQPSGPSQFKLVNQRNLLIKKYIEIDDLKIRRLLGGDPVNPEAINMAIEKVSTYSSRLERKFSKLVAKKLKSYWGNIIIIFGISISIFSIIGNLTTKIQIDPTWSLCDIFLKNLMQVLPLTSVMVIFVIILKLLFR